MNANLHLQSNQHGEEPTTPQALSLPFTSAVFPRTVIPYHALIGNINNETTAAIESNPVAYLAIVPYGSSKKLLEENPMLGKDIEHFIRSLGYIDSGNVRVTPLASQVSPQ